MKTKNADDSQKNASLRRYAEEATKHNSVGALVFQKRGQALLIPRKNETIK